MQFLLSHLHPNIGEGSRAEAARIAVNNLDETAGHEELDEMMANAGRVQVDQKMMINCKGRFKSTCTI